MKSWYAVSTKHNLELLALKNLERQHIHTYLPRVSKKSNIKNSFNRIACRAFFPGYLFVMLDLETDRWQKINSTIGVRKIVNIGSCPVPISSKIISLRCSKKMRILLLKMEYFLGARLFLTSMFLEIIG